MPFVTALVRSVGLILLGLAFIAAPMAALKFGLLPFVDGALAAVVPSSVVHPLSMLVAMTLGYFAYVRLVERRAATELTPRPALALIGVVSAVGLIGVPMLVLYATGFYRLLSFAGIDAIWSVVPTILAAALLEELAFRGVIFSVLERQFGAVIAILSQSLLFGALHMANTGFTKPIDLLGVILIGAMWTLLYAVWRNIWAIGLHHAAWNLTIVVSGLPLSGIEDFRKAAPFQSDFDGARLMTGGDAGPESSLLALAVVCVAIAVISWSAWRRRSLTPPERLT